MPLIKRGRLSVQKVSQGVWPVIQLLAERGGWEDIPNTNATSKGKGKTKATSSKRNTTTTRNQEEEEGDSDNRQDRPSRRGPSKRKKERGVSEEEGSEEDEDGDDLTAAADVAIFKTLAKIRDRDPVIYQKDVNVFEGRLYLWINSDRF